MRTSYKQLPGIAVLAGLILAGSGLAPLQAVETYPINNSNFNNLAPAPSWYWENWSLAGSTNFYDGATADAGGGATNGSLRLVAPYVTQASWQQAVFTLDVNPDFSCSNLHNISFDVKVDPGSTPRATGDYGYFQIILRNGGNWDWRSWPLSP